MTDKLAQRKEIIGDCTLYLGDCLEVMPTLGSGWLRDLVYTAKQSSTPSWEAAQPESHVQSLAGNS